MVALDRFSNSAQLKQIMYLEDAYSEELVDGEEDDFVGRHDESLRRTELSHDSSETDEDGDRGIVSSQQATRTNGQLSASGKNT